MSQERRPLAIAELEQLREWVGTIQGPPPALCLSPECRELLDAFPARPAPEPRRSESSTPPRRQRRGLGWLLVLLLVLLGVAAGWR